MSRLSDLRSEPRSDKREEKVPPWHLGLLLAAALLVYANCLGHGFVWDDQYLVVDNPQIKDWRRAASLFVSDLFPPVMPSGYYRPLQALSYLADYAVWGLLPAGFHLTNILLHGVTALVFYAVAVALLHSTSAALIAASLFAVHPIHTEAIAYVSGRSDPLAAIFLLTALLGFIHHRRRAGNGWLFLSLVCFALALLAREASLALILLLPLIDANERRVRNATGFYASLAASARAVCSHTDRLRFGARRGHRRAGPDWSARPHRVGTRAC